jgi:putative sigma-54 modulation protein
MDLDQAITNMTMLGHDFYIYKDGESENYAVVYKRKNGGYGLIEVEQ